MNRNDSQTPVRLNGMIPAGCVGRMFIFGSISPALRYARDIWSFVLWFSVHISPTLPRLMLCPPPSFRQQHPTSSHKDTGPPRTSRLPTTTNAVNTHRPQCASSPSRSGCQPSSSHSPQRICMTVSTSQSATVATLPA